MAPEEGANGSFGTEVIVSLYFTYAGVLPHCCFVDYKAHMSSLRPLMPNRPQIALLQTTMHQGAKVSLIWNWPIICYAVYSRSASHVWTSILSRYDDLPVPPQSHRQSAKSDFVGSIMPGLKSLCHRCSELCFFFCWFALSHQKKYTMSRSFHFTDKWKTAMLS